MATQDSRIKLKRSTVTATVPTVPSSNDHTDGTWIATDIYKGELFYNQADGVLWTRGDSGIECIQGTAKVVIPTAQVLTLNTTPVQLVAAPPAGYAIDLLSGVFKISFNSVAYATNTDLQIRSVGSTTKITNDVSILTAIANSIQKLTIVPSSDQYLENAGLEVRVDAGDPTAGDSDITVYVTYRIITL
jgi:hypothetical protein